ncbi:VOC family protein [Actinoplanes sp. CA-252034]|uniref:VOC family protein n=1 Tax=Actinoplanes sp. CA-252034 TaxID=3239906 RepID=UPI003D98807B
MPGTVPPAQRTSAESRPDPAADIDLDLDGPPTSPVTAVPLVAPTTGIPSQGTHGRTGSPTRDTPEHTGRTGPVSGTPAADPPHRAEATTSAPTADPEQARRTRGTDPVSTSRAASTADPETGARPDAHAGPRADLGTPVGRSTTDRSPDPVDPISPAGRSADPVSPAGRTTESGSHASRSAEQVSSAGRTTESGSHASRSAEQVSHAGRSAEPVSPAGRRTDPIDPVSPAGRSRGAAARSSGLTPPPPPTARRRDAPSPPPPPVARPSHAAAPPPPPARPTRASDTTRDPNAWARPAEPTSPAPAAQPAPAPRSPSADDRWAAPARPVSPAPRPAPSLRPDPPAADADRRDPAAADPSRRIPAAADPSRPDPATADTGRRDPATADPSRWDQAAADTGRRDPATADTGRPDPATAHTGRRDPATADPSRPDPAAAEAGRRDTRSESSGIAQQAPEASPQRPGAAPSHSAWAQPAARPTPDQERWAQSDQEAAAKIPPNVEARPLGSRTRFFAQPGDETESFETEGAQQPTETQQPTRAQQPRGAQPRPEPIPASAPSAPSPVAPPPTAPQPDRPFPSAPPPATARTTAPRPGIDQIDIPLDNFPLRGHNLPINTNPEPAPEEEPQAAAARADGIVAPPAEDTPRPSALRDGILGVAVGRAAVSPDAFPAPHPDDAPAPGRSQGDDVRAPGRSQGDDVPPPGPGQDSGEQRRAGPWGDFSGRPDERAGDVITGYPSARPASAGAIHGVGITVLVTDLERSTEFYRDVLGFHEIDNGDGSAVLASGDTRLVLRTVHNLTAEAGRLIYLNLEVGDIEAVHAELREKGVKFVHSPRPVNRGDKLELWSATFRDPDNHNIAITQWRAIR